MSDSLVITRIDGRVGIIQLNRPAQLNALNDALMNALGAALIEMERNDDIGCIIVTGSPKAFAAGADISAMQKLTYNDVTKQGLITKNWETVLKVRKPVIAAVAGYALGGGCEVAMMCDFIIAADNAKFGQPEIKIGTIPGAGGSQRLPRAVSKSKAMDMVLTGRIMDAQEAERAGLVSRVVPLDKLDEVALEAATVIAGMSLPIAIAAKEAVNRAYESTLSEGVLFERRNFHATFATKDRQEGMTAFVEKRTPKFVHE
jgi:enoyl-CoA hydratase